MLIKLPQATVTGDVNLIEFCTDKEAKKFYVKVIFDDNHLVTTYFTESMNKYDEDENEKYCEKLNSALFNLLRTYQESSLFGSFLPILEITKDGRILGKLKNEKDPR